MSSLGSHTLATLPEGESKKTAGGITKQAKPARRGKQEKRGRHNETGEACPKGKARKLRAARHSAYRDCLQAAIRQGFPLPQVFSRFSPLREKSKTGCPPHQSTPLTAFPPRGSLDEGKDYPFCRRKFCKQNFMQARGEALKQGNYSNFVLSRLAYARHSPRRGKQEDCGRHNETGEACPKGKARKTRAA